MTAQSEAEKLLALAAFQDDAARYFEKRDTNGEDAAHWANVANAGTCSKTANLLRLLAEPTPQMIEAAERAGWDSANHMPMPQYCLVMFKAAVAQALILAKDATHA